MLRVLLWRLVGVLAVLISLAAAAWLLHGGVGHVLRGTAGSHRLEAVISGLTGGAIGVAREGWALAVSADVRPSAVLFAGVALAALILMARWRARRVRRYVRLRVDPYRADCATGESVLNMIDSLHKRLLNRWWRRVLAGQPSVALEVHHSRTDSVASAWLAVCCPEGSERVVEAALRAAYPNCRLGPPDQPALAPAVLLRLKKSSTFIKRVKVVERFEHEREPAVNRLLTAMAACGEPAFVQLALTPAPASFERLAKHAFKRHEAHLSRERREHLLVRDRSMVEDKELRGGLDVQHRPLFFVDVRVVGSAREVCERVASELRSQGAENRLVERGTRVRHGLLALYRRRVERGEGNPLPSFRKGVFASTELAPLWHLPSIDYATVPFARSGLPLAPAPPSILRPGNGRGTLRDAGGGVSIHPQLRKQNTAVPGAVEQGKSSYLIATVAEDLARDRCAVIVLDPKGDAADAAVSLVPAGRTCTLLDFSRPTCGFNPLAVDAPADVIADYVVASLKNLFTDGDIRASSDRYLRNAIIAVLAFDRSATLWDAARLLSVGEEGYSYRRAVGARVRTLPAYAEISAFFTSELTAQLADARSSTTSKLDAPVNKLARLLNSQSIKRVLLNDSLRVDLDEVIARQHVLVVKGALGTMGAGNTSVLMQLLVGMLDAALARQQDLVPAAERVTVALKVDEAPLVLNRGFAETIALKRSAGLETVACWQTDAQWTDRDIHDQLDALFAHRVYFATASARDAREAVKVMMPEFSDMVRPGIGHLPALARPDVRLHLPKHHAIASWTTPQGRQAPFIAQTIPMRVNPERIAHHATRQLERGGRELTDLSQPHWLRSRRTAPDAPAPAPVARSAQMPSRGAPGECGSPSTVEVPAGDDTRAGASDPPTATAESYRELLELDRAHSVRWARAAQTPRALDPDRVDLDVLALIANLGHVLTTQLHRRFNPARAATTTQRRLKRLSDAGLVDRFQFHRRDGGGVPMCYVITAPGLHALSANDRATADARRDAARPASRTRLDGERGLRRARLEVHLGGWALALERLLEDAACIMRGGEGSILSPPLRSTPDGRVAIGPSELRLPSGALPHDFLRTDATGETGEVERFDTLRPALTIELAAIRGGPPPADLMLEFDDRVTSAGFVAKLERYDHFLAGWSTHTRRYGRRPEAVPIVVFVCRDSSRSRACAGRADQILRASRAYAGEYPADWEYPGREAILFVSERDVHEGLTRGYGVPRLPPEVRTAAASLDPGAGEAAAEQRDLLDTRSTLSSWR